MTDRQRDINDFTKEVECEYRGIKFRVRDNGAVLMLRKEDDYPILWDNRWTFGQLDNLTHSRVIGVCDVHEIVAEAFQLPNKRPYCIIDHIDGNKENNAVCNLRWITQAEKVLENPETREKVIKICGSVDAFLDNPTLLHGHESEDQEFYWMVNMTREQARGLKSPEKPSADEPVMSQIDKFKEYRYKAIEDSRKSVEEEIAKKYPRFYEVSKKPAPEYFGMDVFNKDNDPVVKSKMEEASKLLEQMVSNSPDGYINITAMDVCFFMTYCWKCHLPYDAYFIVRLGIGPEHMMTDFPGVINPLEPTIVNAVKKYLHEHPELKYLMGDIKPRHSSVVDDTYVSFGCPHCDAIYGDFYLKDDIMEEIYYFSEEDVHHIVFEEEVKIKVG